MADKEFSIEESFEKIESIISELESGKVNLNDSIDLYSNGVKLLKECKSHLEGVEKEIIVLTAAEDVEGEENE